MGEGAATSPSQFVGPSRAQGQISENPCFDWIIVTLYARETPAFHSMRLFPYARETPTFPNNRRSLYARETSGFLWFPYALETITFDNRHAPYEYSVLTVRLPSFYLQRKTLV